MFLNGYPYSDFHEMNLDFLLNSMDELKKAFKNFTASNSLIFAEPLLHDLTKSYAKNTIVLDPDGNAYISLQIVPEGVQLSNADYWLMVFNFEEYTEKANKNFTDNYFRDTKRAPYALSVGDWVVLDDVLYKVTVAIGTDDLFEIGTNLVHFTIEQFLKDFVTSVNLTLNNWHYEMTNTINQYKNDIDASELAYRNQLAGDVATTVSSLQSQLNAAIAGVTVDSEVINARISADGVTYATLGDAIRTQVTDIFDLLQFYNIENFVEGYVDTDGTITSSAGYLTSDFIPVKAGQTYTFYKSRFLGVYSASKTFVSRINFDNSPNHNLYAEATYTPASDCYLRVTYYKSEYEAGTVEATKEARPVEIVNAKRLLSSDYDRIMNATYQSGYWNPVGGDTPGASTAYKYVICPVQAGVTYTAYPKTRFISYYDNNFTFIANDPNGNSSAPVSFTPAQDGYVYITFTTTDVDDNKTCVYSGSFNFGKGKYVMNDFVILGEHSIENTLADYLAGKTLAVFGDSIMAGDGNSYIGVGDIMASKYNMTLHDYSTGGATMGYLDNLHSHIIDQVTTAIGDSITPDVIIFNGGTNDMHGTTPNCPLGTMSDVYTQPASSDEFSNGYESVAYAIKNNWPDALVIYVRDHNTSSRPYDRQISYGERAIDISHKWSIGVVNVYNIMNSNIAPIQTAYAPDQTHPNQAGYDTFYIPAIESYIYTNRNRL